MKLSTSTEWLFFHLWKKNPETGISCPGVFIADTIIYRWAQPYFWYFTTKEGLIIRKTKEKVFVNHIEEVFNSNVSESGVVALYMSSQEKPNKKNQDRIEFEYFVKDSFCIIEKRSVIEALTLLSLIFLDYFLYQREKSLNALLQKFIQPKNNKNSLIKVSWSPQFCLLYRKTNIHDLNNNKIPFNDRLVTFEGAEHLSISDSISSPILSSDLEQICINIVKHIQDVSGGNIQISRMVLYFKLDDKNRLWLLYCTGIKVREKFTSSSILKSDTKNSDRILSPLLTISNQQQKTNLQAEKLKKPAQLEPGSSRACAYCEGENDVYEIKFKHLIESYACGIVTNQDKDGENKEDDEALMNKNNNTDQKKVNPYEFYDENDDEALAKKSKNVPKIITKIWGKMSEEKFNRLKANPSWLELTTMVCAVCFVKFTQITLESEMDRQARLTQVKLKESTKKDNELFNLKSFSSNRRKKSIKKNDPRVSVFQNTLPSNYQYNPKGSNFSNNMGKRESSPRKFGSISLKLKEVDSPRRRVFSEENSADKVHEANEIQEEDDDKHDRSKRRNDPLKHSKLKKFSPERKVTSQDEISHGSRSVSPKYNHNEIPSPGMDKGLKSGGEEEEYKSGYENHEADGIQEQKKPVYASMMTRSISKGKSKSNKKYNPAQVYKNKLDKSIKLPRINTSSINKNSLTVSTASSLMEAEGAQSGTKKVNYDYMMNILKDLRTQFKDL